MTAASDSLVARLRRAAGARSDTDAQRMGLAADEIERRERAQADMLRVQIMQAATIRHLRSALERMLSSDLDWENGAIGVGYRFRELARDALKEAPPAEDEPPLGLLVSMAIRADHALGVPGYYDQEFARTKGITHRQRLQEAVKTMRQLWEEVVGRGFYRPEREVEYARLVESEDAD